MKFRHIIILFMTFLAFLGLLFSVSGCTIQPTVYTRADGVQVATRSKSKALSITMVNGTVLTSSGDNDETVVPSNYIQARMMTAVAGIQGGVARNKSNNP